MNPTVGHHIGGSHAEPTLPSAAVRAALPVNLRPKIVSSASEPPSGPDWLHEVKHDGHRLIAMIAGRGSIKLLSRNGKDRTHLFRTPFRDLAIKDHALVLDGEIAVPDERGITHIDALNDALVGKQPDRLTYFAFDLIYADGHDIRRCPIEHRKAALKELIDNVGCERIVYVDHIMGNGDRLFERVKTVGAEGIVSKRLGRSYSGGDARDWLKTKCHQMHRFMITGIPGAWRQDASKPSMSPKKSAERCCQPVRSGSALPGRVYGAYSISFGLANRRRASFRFARC